MRVAGVDSSFRFAVKPRSSRPPGLLAWWVVRLGAMLGAGVFAACAMRTPHTSITNPATNLPEKTAHRLIGVWQQQMSEYVGREGGGDPAVLSRMQVLRSKDALRPARSTFGVLNVESTVPDRDGWDIQGLLLGKQVNGVRTWYVFLVAIVARSGYRPISIQDLRLVGLSVHGGKLFWIVGLPDAQALQRYQDTFRDSGSVRFPGDTDRFTMDATAYRVSVREMQSTAEWSLELGS